MARANSTVYEVRTTGSPTNGGGFVPGASGTDRSQQDSPQYAVADAVANGTTTVTSATANFGTDVVGNIAYIGGDWYQILARTNTTTITVDRTIAAATGLTLNIGGALSDVAVACSLLGGSGGIVYVKAGTYTISSSTASVAGGRISIPSGNGTAQNRLIGYQATRGDYGTAPVLQATASMAGNAIVTVGGTDARVENICADGNSQTTTDGIAGSGGGNTHAYFCEAKRCRNGFNALRGTAYQCSSHHNTNHGFNGAGGGQSFNYCEAYENGGDGWNIDATAPSVSQCLSYRNTGRGFSLTNGSSPFIQNSTAAYNGGDGIYFNNAATTLVVNDPCVSYGNGGYDLRFNASNSGRWPNWAVGQRTTAGGITGNAAGTFENLITLTASPFTNAVGTAGGASDFSLNNTTGGGASIRAATYPPYRTASSPRYSPPGGQGYSAAGGGGGGSIFRSPIFAGAC
jgi:hypothetical protein